MKSFKSFLEDIEHKTDDPAFWNLVRFIMIVSMYIGFMCELGWLGWPVAVSIHLIYGALDRD